MPLDCLQILGSMQSVQLCFGFSFSFCLSLAEVGCWLSWRRGAASVLCVDFASLVYVHRES